MISNPVIFYISAFILIFCAILSVCLKNVIYSLLASVLVFFDAALLFYVLGSEYNAIIQASIYGFAVPVIIGVSIMFTGRDAKKHKGFTLPYITILCGGIFVLAFLYIIMISILAMPDTFNLQELVQVSAFDTLSAFAKGLFVNYVWAFELVSLLLTIVIAGITMFNQKRGGIK